ncbi:MAG: cobalamin-dependent protein [Candidatus Gastranaerophilales bacterium]|nr:cobalamin-dependent protein [Candidatus Gastranaerophilales bacterium]
MSKFKCILVHTPQLVKNIQDGHIASNVNYCAMGLYSLANELEKEGFNAEIIHLGIEKYLDKKFKLSKYVRDNDIKFVAFSLHWHPQSFDVIESIRILKEQNPNVFVMIGGFTASYFGREILDLFPFVDTVLKGEGEAPIKMLAKKVCLKEVDFSDIPNLFWRKNGSVVLNDKKFVASNEDLDSFEFFDIKKMRNYQSYAKVPFFLDYAFENALERLPMSSQGVCIGRGCEGNCTWCGGGADAMKCVTGRDFVSYRNVENILDEIKMLKKDCGIEVFRFAFDPQPKKREFLIRLLNRIAEEFSGTLKTSFTLNGLPDKVFLDAYSKAFSPDSILAISPEFASEDLRKFHKSFFYTNKELENILVYMEELKIKSELYFAILPCVDEVENVKSETYAKKLKEKYKYIDKYYIIPIIYEPAAPWTMNPEKYGVDFVPKKFIDYYNSSKNVENSFENIDAFLSN